MSKIQPSYNAPQYPSSAPLPPPRPNSTVYPSTYDYRATPIPPPRPSTAYIARYASEVSHGQPSSSSWSHPQQFPTMSETPQIPLMSDSGQFATPQSTLLPHSSQAAGRPGASSYSRQNDYRSSNYSTGIPASLQGEHIVSGSVVPSTTFIPEPTSSMPPPTSSFDPRPFATIEAQPTTSNNFSNSEAGGFAPAPPRSSSLNQPYLGQAQTPTLPAPRLTTPTNPIKLHPCPTAESLTYASAKLDSWTDAHQITWAQDVVRLVERYWQQTSNADHFEQPPSPPSDSQHLSITLQRLLDTAAPIVIAISDSDIKEHASLALYLKGKLLSSGASPALLPKDKRQSFKDFEGAARKGEKRAWYRLGKDYEAVNDLDRAGDCYDRGAKAGDCESAFRMGMAHLLGQLNFLPDPATGLYFLHQSSDTASIDFPQASYVYGMLLAGDITLQTNLPPSLIIPPTSPPTDALLAQQNLACESIARAAYLNYPAAQFKLGQMYEHADLGCVYDPIASVAWYTFASQNGEMEADMALSKWFLCGAEGHFPKNESSAKTYAEKAARKGHPNGCFALGYYNEIGVGTDVDLEQARKWYEKAAKAGNAEASTRLAALSLPVPTAISMNEHQSRLNDTLVRKHTTAKLRSDRNKSSRPVRQQIYESQHPPPLPSYGQTNSLLEFGQVSQIQMPMALPKSPPPISHTPSPVSSLTVPPMNYSSHQPQPSYALQDPPINPSRPPMHEHQYSSHSTSTTSTGGGRQSSSTPRPISVVDHRRMSTVSSSVNDFPVLSASSSTSISIPSSGPTSTISGGISGTMEKKRKKKKGPQTFAEMGFVSKPVEEDGCVIM